MDPVCILFSILYIQCTLTCGGGVHQRAVACSTSRCRRDIEPATQDTCNEKSCDDHRHHKDPENTRGHNLVLKDIVDIMLRDKPEGTEGPEVDENDVIGVHSDGEPAIADTAYTTTPLQPSSPPYDNSRPADTAENKKKSTNHRWIPLFWSEVCLIFRVKSTIQ